VNHVAKAEYEVRQTFLYSFFFVKENRSKPPHPHQSLSDSNIGSTETVGETFINNKDDT